MTPHIKRASAQSGFTLIEVMVAIGILSLLMVLLTTTIVKGMQLSRGMGVRLDNINQGQLGMNAATKALRTAVLPRQLVDRTCTGSLCGSSAITFATPTKVTFYANLNNTGQGPSIMSYYLESGNLVQTTQAPQVLVNNQYSFCDTSVAGCVPARRVVTRGLDPASPTFKYYNLAGALMLATPLTTDLVLIHSIDITLTVQTNSVQKVPPNTIVQRVTLPNAYANTQE